MSVLKIQITDYNDIASEYDAHEKNAETLWHLGYRYLFSYLNPTLNTSILDYGCGSGIFCRYMREYNANVTGVDISENMLRVAKKGYPKDITYNQITSGNLNFLPDNSFDFVVSNFVFCTISTGNEILGIMKSINRILKKNGNFIIMNPNWDESNGKEFISFKLQYNRNLSSGKPVTAVIKTEPPIIMNDYYWSKANYIYFLTESGFEISSIKEPRAKVNDFPWISEKTNPPYFIINAKKQLSE